MSELLASVINEEMGGWCGKEISGKEAQENFFPTMWDPELTID